MVPDKSDKRWRLLVTGEKEYNFQILPARILLARMISSIKNDNSPANIQQCIEDTYNFFLRYQAILQEDIENIFGDP
jgi:hypothetical protein